MHRTFIDGDDKNIMLKLSVIQSLLIITVNKLIAVVVSLELDCDPTRAALGVKPSVFNAGTDYPPRVLQRAPLKALCASACSLPPPACSIT